MVADPISYMKNFFKPNSLKIKITVGLIVYILLGLIFTASFNTTRSKKQVEINSIERVGIVVSFPTVYFSLPLIYTSQNVFTKQTTLRELYQKDGMVGEINYNPNYDSPITQQTSLGFVAGIIVEVLFLYFIACIFSSFKNLKRKKI